MHYLFFSFDICFWTDHCFCSNCSCDVTITIYDSHEHIGFRFSFIFVCVCVDNEQCSSVNANATNNTVYGCTNIYTASSLAKHHKHITSRCIVHVHNTRCLINRQQTHTTKKNTTLFASTQLTRGQTFASGFPCGGPKIAGTFFFPFNLISFGFGVVRYDACWW